jgi:hypothetical protein
LLIDSSDAVRNQFKEAASKSKKIDDVDKEWILNMIDKY